MGKYLLFLLTLTLLLLQVNQAFSQQRKWILFSENDTSRYFYDSLTIHPHGNIIFIWEMEEKVSEGRHGYGRKVLYIINRIEFLCSQMKYRIISSTIYHSNGTTTTDNVVSGYYYPGPGSKNLNLLNIVCQNSK